MQFIPKQRKNKEMIQNELTLRLLKQKIIQPLNF